MTKVILRATEGVLVVPSEVLAESGPAEEFEVEITPLPGAEDIQLRALYYAGHKLGSAIGVEAPVREGEDWRVDLVSPDGRRVLGSLILDRYGEVDTSRSATYESVRQSGEAARSTLPAA